MEHSDGGTQKGKTTSITFREAFHVWLKIGLMSFGGPAGQIALMHRVLVEEKRWVSESRFLHALNYCMLLPGPEAQQLATYVGWLLHKTLGGLVAGTLFILPGAVVILALSVLYAGYNDLTHLFSSTSNRYVVRPGHPGRSSRTGIRGFYRHDRDGKVA